MKKQWFRLISFRICLLCFVMACAVFIGIMAQSVQDLSKKANSTSISASPVIILDAGHGGMDGGAVAKNGTPEKEINLAIANKLRKLLESQGFHVVMTRESDDFIGDNTLPSLAERKKSDMKARLQVMREHPEGIFVSIHQNYFEKASNNGAQVFYSPNHEKSTVLADCIQKSVVSKIQKENTRQSKESEKTIYLLRNAEIPAVLVECGFLSNQKESEKLGEDTYQNQMAFSIFCGILDYCAV